MNSKSKNMTITGPIGLGMISAIISFIVMILIYTVAKAALGAGFWIFFLLMWFGVYMLIADRG